MISKVVVLAALVSVAVASLAADRYPAGLNPALCPNYPHCDNVLLALYAQAHAPVAPVAVGPSVWGGREYPAGVSPAACPNYPYCHTGLGAVAPLPGFAQREYPAGVSPAACPNYPYCH